MTRRAAVNDFVWPLAVFGALAFVPKVGWDVPKLFDGAISSPGTLQLLALCLLYAGLALTYDLLFGFTGLLSFGHALYVAVGVYMANIAITQWHWSFAEAVLFTALLGFVVPLVLGTVSLRVSGIAFAMVTLAFAQAGSVLVHKDPRHWTHGEEGLGVDYQKLPDSLVGIFNTKHLYWLALGYLAVVFFIVRWAVESSPGRVWQAIRENELRVEVLGLRPRAYKLMSFVLASFLATIGGIVYLLLFNSLEPGSDGAELHARAAPHGRDRRRGHALGRSSRRRPLHVSGQPARRARQLVGRAGPAEGAANAARAAAVPARNDLHPDRLLPPGRDRRAGNARQTGRPAEARAGAAAGRLGRRHAEAVLTETQEQA